MIISWWCVLHFFSIDWNQVWEWKRKGYLFPVGIMWLFWSRREVLVHPLLLSICCSVAGTTPAGELTLWQVLTVINWRVCIWHFWRRGRGTKGGNCLSWGDLGSGSTAQVAGRCCPFPVQKQSGCVINHLGIVASQQIPYATASKKKKSVASVVAFSFRRR